ncbi:MAG: hypothetical protein JOY78_18160 [Pseudonocardia sp.]|nr:hypothetical protein [Pseudonocardia sp.]
MSTAANSLTVWRYASTDPRLGRHQVHDERSRNFALAPVPLPRAPVMHERRAPIFDQGHIGSCTANAGLGMMASMPKSGAVANRLWTMDVDPATWVEADALKLYEEETRLDDREIPGHYPPDDTGSASLYVGKALRARGWVATYWHGFSLTSTLGWLGRQPVIVGIPWLESMFTPDRQHHLVVDRRSGIAGGHEVCLDDIDPDRSLVRVCNSWGKDWPRSDEGRAWLSYADLGWLLSQGGDALTVS